MNDAQQIPQKIAIIGAGWVGVSAALELRKRGYEVTIYEKNADIFRGVSGTYGLRIHEGPHYPRSENTRKSCQRGHIRFRENYPDLVVPHEYSIYGFGDIDADGNPPKVDPETFRSVCQESQDCREIDPNYWGYHNLLNAFTVDEPSTVVGDRLRSEFWKYLNDANVDIICNYHVNNVLECCDFGRSPILIGEPCLPAWQISA